MVFCQTRTPHLPPIPIPVSYWLGTQLCSRQHFSPLSPATFPQVPSNKRRLALLLSLPASCINHSHNYRFRGAARANMRIPPSHLLPPTPTSHILPRLWRYNPRRLSAPLAEAEELVSRAASSGDELLAVGLQLPVALLQASIHPPQVLHDRCVHSVVDWQLPNEASELLWYDRENE